MPEEEVRRGPIEGEFVVTDDGQTLLYDNVARKYFDYDHRMGRWIEVPIEKKLSHLGSIGGKDDTIRWSSNRIVKDECVACDKVLQCAGCEDCAGKCSDDRREVVSRPRPALPLKPDRPDPDRLVRDATSLKHEAARIADIAKNHGRKTVLPERKEDGLILVRAILSLGSSKPILDLIRDRSGQR